NQNVTQFPVDINILNPGHVLKPGMNTEVEIHVGTRDSVLAIPTSALRTQKDVASAAQVLGLDPTQVMAQLAAQAPKPAPNIKGDTAASMGNSAAAPGTMTLPDGRTVKLPAGVTAAQMQAVFAKMAGGNFASLTPADRDLLTKMRQANGGGMGGGGGGRGRGGLGGGPGGGAGTGQSNTYIVFALRGGKPTPVTIKTGLSDLDYIEVASGLTEQDTVLLLPSASLVQSQQQFKQRVQGITGGGLPGVRQQPQAAGAR
ncbi:MAG TPA: hypothetical protein VNX15_06460, partial [Gemmatimonadales bacterium]|nr:hypothetical protein [Gemmatimonadales bacterium]